MLKILDCTLRDGGYINQWEFGNKNIKRILNNLIEAKLDIVECGYLSNKGKVDSSDTTQFYSIEQIDKILESLPEANYVCMINYGEYNLEDICDVEDTLLSGIRLAFHKKDRIEAVDYAAGLKRKGYDVYLQPMVSLSYTDVEFVELISRANEIGVFAFYIVDSFGVMKQSDLLRLFYLTNHNLRKDIWLGYHSHNNLQLAFSNAQAFVSTSGNRNLIIDSSIMGMGRGAGNLNTELFLGYVNDNLKGEYNILPILQAIDKVINVEYQQKGWGYSLPHYLSASCNCHPNYATFLDDKHTLTVVEINDILMEIPDNKRFGFDKDYVQKLYEKYQSKKVHCNTGMDLLRETFGGKEVLLLAPGKSSVDEIDKIRNFVEKYSPIVVSVNFTTTNIKSDYVFYSNIRRYMEGTHDDTNRVIITSNIGDTYGVADYVVEYATLLNEHPAIKDNSAMMLIRLLISLGVEKIILAGLDGYSNDVAENYAQKDMALITKQELLKTMNQEMRKQLEEFSKEIKISFVTEPKNIVI